MAGVGHCDAAGCEQKDAFADPLLMTIDGEGATGYEVNSTLGLIGLHHREVQDDRFALPQGLNRAGHFIETAGFHQVHLRRC